MTEMVYILESRSPHGMVWEMEETTTNLKSKTNRVGTDTWSGGILQTGSTEDVGGNSPSFNPFLISHDVSFKKQRQ